jgi:hypothetical protein
LRNLSLFFSCFLLLLNSSLFSKVRILTFHYNKPEFIKLQYLAFSKFSKDEFEIIVFNDAADPVCEQQINEMCSKYDIKCVRFEPEWHKTDPLNDYIKQCLENPENSTLLFFNTTIYNQPSVRHCHVIQYALDNYAYNHDDIIAIIDGDCFPIRSFSLHDWLSTYNITGIQRIIHEYNVDYFWVVFVAFNPSKIPDLNQLKFHTDIINNRLHDSGSHSYYYLKNHPNLLINKCPGHPSSTIRHFSYQQLRTLGFTDDEIWLVNSLPKDQSVEFDMNNHLLHFCGSSFNIGGSSLKEKYLTEFLNKILTN